MPTGPIDWARIMQQSAQNPMMNMAMGGASQFPIQTRLAGANSLLPPPQTSPLQGIGGFRPTATPAASAGAGGLRGILGQLSGGVGGRGMGLGAAGLMAGGGQLAGGLAQGMWNDPESGVDNALASALRWGGGGAALGSFAGPVGAAAGGAGGALFGAFKGLMDSRNEGSKAVASELNKQRSKLAELMTQMGSSADLREQALYQLQLRVATGEFTSKDQVKAAAAEIRAQLPDAILADQQEQETKRSQQANQAAVQAWMGPMLQESLNKSQFYADQFSNAGMSAANQITDPSLRASQQQLARGYSSDQASLNAAYMAQIAAAPSYWGHQSNLLELINQGQRQLQSSTGGQDIWAQIMAQQQGM